MYDISDYCIAHFHIIPTSLSPMHCAVDGEFLCLNATKTRNTTCSWKGYEELKKQDEQYKVKWKSHYASLCSALLCSG